MPNQKSQVLGEDRALNLYKTVCNVYCSVFLQRVDHTRAMMALVQFGKKSSKIRVKKLNFVNFE